MMNIRAFNNSAHDNPARLEEVVRRFRFRTTAYYSSLINWDDPNDPLCALVYPHESELDEDYGSLDTSDESSDTVVKGLQHKYEKTALLLVSKACAAYCRYCFRKRLFMEDNDEVAYDISQAVAYIRSHREIESVVLSGGDPMVLSTSRIRQLLSELSIIPHVKTIRIDTKILSFEPSRVIEDEDLLRCLAAVAAGGEARVYLITQYTHPRELTQESVRALGLVQAAAVSVYNQVPLLRGINDDASVLAALLSSLISHGVTPYYIFIGRPVLGNRRFALPLRQAWSIYTDAISRCTGLAKTAKSLCPIRAARSKSSGS